MGLNIISADERMARRHGVKALILGPAGVGKTSLLRTLDPTSTLFLDFEAGDLAVQDVPCDQVTPKTWQECRDLACFLAGPDMNLPPNAGYGSEHYDAVQHQYGDTDLSKYETYFIDSITVSGRICFKWCEQQAECRTKSGEPDTRATYGLHGREMIKWITQLQHAREKNVVFVGLLDEVKDDFGRTSYAMQIEGQKTGREMPGIVDEVLTMSIITPEEGDPFRALVCHPDNEFGFPAKDRSGLLDCLEQPQLNKLFEKLTRKKG